jgi:hypothetical protein
MLSADLRILKHFFDLNRAGDGSALLVKPSAALFSGMLAEAIVRAEALEATALVNVRALLEADLPGATEAERELLARAAAQLEAPPAYGPDIIPFPLERRIRNDGSAA